MRCAVHQYAVGSMNYAPLLADALGLKARHEPVLQSCCCSKRCSCLEGKCYSWQGFVCVNCEDGLSLRHYPDVKIRRLWRTFRPTALQPPLHPSPITLPSPLPIELSDISGLLNTQHDQLQFCMCVTSVCKIHVFSTETWQSVPSRECWGQVITCENLSQMTVSC